MQGLLSNINLMEDCLSRVCRLGMRVHVKAVPRGTCPFSLAVKENKSVGRTRVEWHNAIVVDNPVASGFWIVK